MTTLRLQIQLLRNLRPARARSEVFTHDEAEIDRNRQVTLVDGLFCPIGPLLHIAAEKMENRVRWSVAYPLCHIKQLHQRHRCLTIAAAQQKSRKNRNR